MATDGEAYIDAAQQPLDAASADTTVDNSLSTAVPQTVEFLVSNVAVVSKKKKKRGVGHKGGLRKLTKGDKKELKGMVADYIERGTFEEILWVQQKEVRLQELRERARARARRSEERMRASLPDDSVYDTSEWTQKLVSRLLRGDPGSGVNSALFRLTDPTLPGKELATNGTPRYPPQTVQRENIRAASDDAATETSDDAKSSGKRLDDYLESLEEPAVGDTVDSSSNTVNMRSSLKMAAEKVIKMGYLGRRRSVDKIERYRELKRQEMSADAAVAKALITAPLPKARAFALFWSCAHSTSVAMAGGGACESDSDVEDGVAAASDALDALPAVEDTGAFHDEVSDTENDSEVRVSEAVDTVMGDVLQLLQEMAMEGGGELFTDSFTVAAEDVAFEAPQLNQEDREAAEAAARRAEMERWIADDERKERTRRRLGSLGEPDWVDDQTDETSSGRYLRGYIELSTTSQLTTDPTVTEAATNTSPTRRFVNTADKTFFYRGYHRDRLPMKNIDISKRLAEVLQCADNDDAIDDELELSTDYEWASSKKVKYLNGRSIQIPSVPPETRARRDPIGEALTRNKTSPRVVVTITAYELEIEHLTGVDTSREDTGQYYYAYRPGLLNAHPTSDGALWPHVELGQKDGSGSGIAGPVYLSRNYNYDDKRHFHRTVVSPIRRLARYPIRSRGQNFEEVVFDPHDLSLNVFKTRDGVVKSHIIVGLQSVSATRSRFPEMVTLRSSERGGSYLGTIQGKFWASLLGDIQIGVIASIRAKRKRIVGRSDGSDGSGAVTFLTGGGGDTDFPDTSSQSAIGESRSSMVAKVAKHNTDEDWHNAAVDSSQGGLYSAEYYTSLKLKPGVIIEDSVFGGSVVSAVQHGQGLSAIGDAFSDFDNDLFESTYTTEASSAEANPVPPRGPSDREDREVFIAEGPSATDDLAVGGGYDASPEARQRRAKMREVKMRQDIINKIVKFPSIVLPFEQIRQPSKPYLSLQATNKLSAPSLSPADSKVEGGEIMLIDGVSIDDSITDAVSARIPLYGAQQSPTSLMDLSETFPANQSAHTRELSSMASLQSAVPRVAPSAPVRPARTIRNRSASAHRRVVPQRGGLYQFESAYNSKVADMGFVIQGGQPSFSTTLIASPVAVKVPTKKAVVSRKSKLLAEENVRNSIRFPKNFVRVSSDRHGGATGGSVVPIDAGNKEADDGCD